MYYQPEFIDTDSVRRDGDEVSLDFLRVVWTFTLKPNKPGETQTQPIVNLNANLEHYRLSCAWRTELSLPTVEEYDDNGALVRDTHGPEGARAFIGSKSSLISVLDRACAGQPLEHAKGFSSVANAIIWSKTQMGAAPAGLPPIAAPRPDPVETPWMVGELPHRFAHVDVADDRGAALYLDTANLKRRGGAASGISFAVLGAIDQRAASDYVQVAVLRRVEYDCKAETMTVTAQAGWTRGGELNSVHDNSFTPRKASESPVIAAEIAAACHGQGLAATPVYADVFDAWGAERSRWPARLEPVWSVSCIWTGLGVDSQNRMIEAIKSNTRVNLGLTPEAYAKLLADCRVPTAAKYEAQSKLSRYLVRATAIQYFQSKGVSEQRLRDSWLNLSWRERALLTRVQSARGPGDQPKIDAIMNKASGPLGIISDDDRRMYMYFMFSEAVLNPG